MHRLAVLVALFAAIPAARAADLTISAAATSNVTFSNGVYTGSPTLAGNLNAADLVVALASQPVTVRAPTGDIIVVDNISWSSSSSLRLEAFRNVALGAAMITNTGGATIQLRADSTGTGTGTVTATSGAVTSTGGSVEVFYNPVAFPTTETIYLGGTAPIAYMLVNSLTNLQNMRFNRAASYALGRDIDASPTATMNAGAGFNPVGAFGAPFFGRFNGDGHSISRLFINRPISHVGLFGFVSNATIQNVDLVDVNITGSLAVGALAGSVDGTTAITRASSSGAVTATNSFAGGLVGDMLSQSLTLSKSSASVTAGGNAGGLVGVASPNTALPILIANCYATGTVSAPASAGGLAGAALNQTTIDRSYSSGVVSATGGGLVGSISGPAVVTNAFWDTETSGLATSAGGTGKTTAQMRQQATFSPAFDFVNIWTITEGLTFPHFGINEAPILNDTPGLTTFVEADTVASTPVAIDPTMTLYDVDSVTATSATVVIDGRLTEAEDVLALVNDGVTMGNIAGSYDPSTGTLTLTSDGTTATMAEWQAALRAVTYTNVSDQPLALPRSMTFRVSDGAATSAPKQRFLDVVSTNDAPQISAPAAITTTVSVPVSLGSIAFSDGDAGAATVSATLTVDSGTLSAISGGGVIVAGTGVSMKLSGSIAAINAFIAAQHVTFTGPTVANVNLAIHIDDNGNSGGGGPPISKTSNASVIIHVVPAAPVLASAAASSDSAVTVTWVQVAGATGYEIYRTTTISAPYAYIGTAASADTSFNDTGRTPNTAYLYKVSATSVAGPSSLSNHDVATTIAFEDPDLAGVAVKAVHILQLRTAVNAMLVAANQPPSFSIGDPTGVAIAAQDIIDLRNALDLARAQMSLPPLTYSNAPPVANVTAIRKADFYDLRNGVE